MTQQPYPTPAAPMPKAKNPRKGMAITALVLGIIALAGSPIPILNNATIICGFIGLVFGIIALFGTHRVMTISGVVMAIAGIAIGLVLQAQWGRQLGQISDPISNGAPTLPAPAGNQTPNTAGQPKANAQGYIPKALGEAAGLSSPDGSSESTFTIDKITVDPKCSRYGFKPQSGHTLLLDVRVATGPDADVASELSGILSPFSFQAVGADSVTHQAQVGACTDTTKALVNSGFGPNQKYSGTIELVVPDSHGTLRAVLPTASNDGVLGWEWKY
jgi:hypothetical protein